MRFEKQYAVLGKILLVTLALTLFVIAISNPQDMSQEQSFNTILMKWNSTCPDNSNITYLFYTSNSGGTPIVNQTFTSSVTNGVSADDINTTSLITGNIYWVERQCNGVTFPFSNGATRLRFDTIVGKGGLNISSLKFYGELSVIASTNTLRLNDTRSDSGAQVLFNSEGADGEGAIGYIAGSHATIPKDTLFFQTNGTVKMYLSPIGYLGFGTSSPIDDINIVHNQDGSTRLRMENYDASGTSSQVDIRLIGNDSESYFGAYSRHYSTPLLQNSTLISAEKHNLVVVGGGNGVTPDGDIIFLNGGYWAENRTMTLTKTHNVGIGTKNPSKKLHIRGGDILINDTTGSASIDIRSADDVASYILLSNYTKNVWGIRRLGTASNSLDIWNYNLGNSAFRINISNNAIRTGGTLILGSGSSQTNITLTSPDANEWCCGVDNSGTFSCSAGACS